MVRLIRLAAIVLALAAAWAPVPASWVETAYSRRAYLAWQRHLTSWSNAVPLAVTDLLGVAALAVAAVIVFRTWREWRRASAVRSALGACLSAATAGAIVYLVFLASWGLNYRRVPLSARLDFARGRVTAAAASELARAVVGRLNALNAPVHQAGFPAWEDLPSTLGPSFAAVQRQLADVRPAVPGIPKWSVLTFYFERAGVSGMTDPFALEVVVDRALLPVERAFVAAHEWAHLAGYASEDEANFVGWVVCLQGPPDAEYSGDLVLLMHLLAAVPDSERPALFRSLDEGPREDIAAIRRRASLGWPWLQRPAWWLYDRYLRANRVEKGVQSYGAALELMLGTRFRDGWQIEARR